MIVLQARSVRSFESRVRSQLSDCVSVLEQTRWRRVRSSSGASGHDLSVDVRELDHWDLTREIQRATRGRLWTTGLWATRCTPVFGQCVQSSPEAPTAL
jgi:hypothetical protein